jgi:hypothetical protein
MKGGGKGERVGEKGGREVKIDGNTWLESGKWGKGCRS